MKLSHAFAVFLLVVALVLTGIIFAGAQYHQGTVIDNEQASIQADADSMAAQLDAQLAEKEQTVAVQADHPDVLAGEDGRNSLQTFIETTNFQGVSVIAENGTMIGLESENLTEAEREETVGEDFSDREYHRTVLETGGTHVSEPIEAETGNHIAAVSAPVVRDGEVVATLNAAFHIQHGDIFRAVTPADEEAVQVVYAADTGGEETLYRSGLWDRAERHTADATLETVDWTVTAARSDAAVQASLRTTTVAQTGAILLVIMILAGFSTWIYRANLRQIDRLLEGFERLGDREYGSQVDLAGPEEWNRIGRSFNEVSEELARHERELKAYEAELEATIDQLEQSNAELKQFTYVAYHDLQEPLRMISGHLTLLEDEYGDELDEEARESIDHAVTGAIRMKRLIDDLLEFSRVETGDLEFERVDSGRALERALENLAASIDDSEATVTVDDLPTVAGDEDQIVQLFQNLVSNAIQYSEGEPTVHVSAEKREEEYVFGVEDDGVGIPDYQQETVFDLFTRGERSEGDSKTGIGLAVCKRIVEAHGGEIRVESEPKAGSMFYFTLPTTDKIQRKQETS
ncbi:sensor histidine kinase [Natrialbaceae archaeon A-gly3]